MRAAVLMLLVAVAAAAGATLPDELIEEWNAFKLKYQKSYQDEAEEKYRMKIFAENRHTVNEHNKRYERGEVTYTMGINKFSDLLANEFYNMMTGYNRFNKKTHSNLEDADNKGAMFIPSDDVPVPDSVDWRKRGAVTPVKDYGRCWGASIAYAAAGALESQYFIKNNKTVLLSAKNLVDCSDNFGCQDGNTLEMAYKYIIANGIATEESYPYKDYIQPCKYSEAKRGASMVNYTRLPWGDEKALIQAVATVGPVAAMMLPIGGYRSGVYYNPFCYNNDAKAGVLVVGYGTDEKSGLDYWIVKTSLGEHWGDAGYMLLARDKFNTCGITNSASYPII